MVGVVPFMGMFFIIPFFDTVGGFHRLLEPAHPNIIYVAYSKNSRS